MLSRTRLLPLFLFSRLTRLSPPKFRRQTLRLGMTVFYLVFIKLRERDRVKVKAEAFKTHPRILPNSINVMNLFLAIGVLTFFRFRRQGIVPLNIFHIRLNEMCHNA